MPSNNEIREMIREELNSLIKSDRFTFEKLIQILDGRNIQLGRTTGTKIGTATDQKIAFYGITPVIQQSSTGEEVGFTANGGTNTKSGSTHTGNVGSTAYTVSDIVKHLKNLGLIAQ
jgi:hypothetical protein